MNQILENLINGAGGNQKTNKLGSTISNMDPFDCYKWQFSVTQWNPKFSVSFIIGKYKPKS